MVRTRFAPSPTGYLHIGSLRTALFDYLFTRQNRGVFVLRIEDTDQKRLVPGATEKIIETLHDLGLDPDEGPGNIGGKYGPYVQSERLGIYAKYASQLLDEEKAYYCFCTEARLDELKKQQSAAGLLPHYDGRCRVLPHEEVRRQLDAGVPHVIRFRMPATGITEYDDVVHGHLQFRNDLQDDLIIVKSDGFPVYNFANVVDDHLMEITHIFRGEEFLPSTPKFVRIYEALGWALPQFVHLPLILDTKRQKLSKRAGDVAVEDYLKKGYLKEALFNFIALLGWNPKTTQEIFSLDDLVREFSLEKINKAGAIFDTTKLDFINRQWQKRLKLKPQADPMFARAAELLSGKLGDVDTRLLALIWPQVTERVAGPFVLDPEIFEFAFYFRLPEYEAPLLVWKKSDAVSAKKNLTLVREFLAALKDEDFTREILEKKSKAFIEEKGEGIGSVLWPLRVALSGQKNSPGPFEIMAVFARHPGRDEIFRRIDAALAKLS